MKATTLAGTDPARTPQRRSTRPIGREIRALVWLLRHPGFTAAARPCSVWAGYTWGRLWPASVLGAAWPVVVLVWWRAHPPTFDRWAAPWLRSAWRRWTDYRGPHWRGRPGRRRADPGPAPHRRDPRARGCCGSGRSPRRSTC